MCKLIKQRCREICPSMAVFLDVDDLTSGYGTMEVDHSHVILVFALPIYFEKRVSPTTHKDPRNCDS